MAEKTWTTGFCNVGSHEGLKPRSPSGKPLKTCERLITYRGKSWSCNCKCHSDLDRMFEMMGMPRYIEPNPDYTPEPMAYEMPSLEERVALSIERRSVPSVVIESPAPLHVPATVAPVYSPTPTGRAHRGELELRVKQACDQWVIDKPDESCTPQWISDQIAAKHDIKNPSVGAIGAVFDRWTKLNFALIGRKPVRFIGYTDEGVKHGLDGLKMQAKMQRSPGDRR